MGFIGFVSHFLGFSQVPVEIPGLELGTHDSSKIPSYSALLEAMEVTMTDNDSELNFSSINQLPSTPQDPQATDWYDNTILKNEF